jgi:hypothetical protein
MLPARIRPRVYHVATMTRTDLAAVTTKTTKKQR